MGEQSASIVRLYFIGKSLISLIPDEVELVLASQLGWPPATQLDLLFHPPAECHSGSSRRTWKGSSRKPPLYILYGDTFKESP